MAKKLVAEFFLSPVDDENPLGDWKCRCDETAKKSNTGWNNLCLHVVRRHRGKWFSDMEAAIANGEWNPEAGLTVPRHEVTFKSFCPPDAQKVFG